ncbi:hypothetical protein [Methyloprofundus sp.]|uniref:hypothetical protein n=1 Tax=Methyloprofundus sp. TaxID=2020875 RepID=UPI003D0F67FA
MSDTLSSNAVIYAILSINSEVALQKEYLDSPDVLPEERENEEGILDDLEQAFMEFVDFYKSCRKQDSSLPELDELLNNPL